MNTQAKLARAIQLLTEVQQEMTQVTSQAVQPNLKELITTPQWSTAVSPELICAEDSEEDKKERAEGVLDITKWEFKEKSFLDFGCGEGHTIAIAAHNGAVKAVGYDITEQWMQPQEPSLGSTLLTTNYEVVQKQGPFDLILLYDVLDHATNPQNVLTQAMAVLSPGGIMFVRNHPWVSRHGGHLYRHLNKAFAHVLLSPEELKSLDIPMDETVQKIIHPKGTYESWFKSVGLTKVQEALRTEPVERFFQTGPAKQKFDEIYAESKRKGWKPEHNYTFMDYILTKE